MSLHTETLGLKLAAALLLRHGELSVRDIRAMPFFSTPDHVQAVVAFLLRTFDAEIQSRRVSPRAVPMWEEFIRLRKGAT